MDKLRAMAVFAKVVDQGSFVGAAEAMQIAPAVVTRLVAELEQHLGVRLLQRSTRKLTLTELGQLYLQKVRGVLVEVEEAESSVTQAMHTPRGVVRLLAPPSLAIHLLGRILPAFHLQYPEIRLIVDTRATVETVDESHDLTLVLSRNSQLEGAFVAQALARSEVVAVASPHYLGRAGTPQHPSDLAKHQLLVPPISDVQRELLFTPRPGSGLAGEPVAVQPKRMALSASLADMNLEAVRHGLGITGLPSYVVAQDLAFGSLVRLLPDWQLFSTYLFLCRPSRQYVPARTRALIDFLMAQCCGQPADDPWLNPSKA